MDLSDETGEVTIPVILEHKEVHFHFDRVTVFLGANGTGKSRILSALISESTRRVNGESEIYVPLGSRESVVNVEGGRVIEAPPSVFELRPNRPAMRNVNKRGRLRERINDLFQNLAHSSLSTAFKDRELQREAQREQRQLPALQDTSLETLFALFHEVFPDITLHLDDWTIKASKRGGNRYMISDLSDGERQVFAILADLVVHAVHPDFVLVDEPELNLHPSLAIRLWDVVENANPPPCRFVYATHSISFAMRPSTEKIYVLSADIHEPVIIDSVQQMLRWPRKRVHDFLGAIPAIVHTPNALVTEGDETSFDNVFYRWVLGKEWILSVHGVGIVPLGGCENVKAAVRGEGLWRELGAHTNVVGVIDHDYDEHDGSESGVWVLELFDAESYLCLPELLCDLAAKRAQSTVPSIAQIEDDILSFASSQKIKIAVRRAEKRLASLYTFSIPRDKLASIALPDEVTAVLEEKSSQIIELAEMKYANGEATKFFEEEYDAICSAISSRSIDDLLRLLPGKKLLPRLAHRVGYRKSIDVVKGCSTLLDAGAYAPVAKLRETLREILVRDS